jgi:hypothetical protein
MSRTIHIQVTNWCGVPLNFENPQTQEGPPATASAPSVSNGGTITVTATNNSTFRAGNKGTFQLNGNGVTYTIFYTHPQLNAPTYIKLQSATQGYVAGIGEQSYTGDPVTATMNLYWGVSVQSATSTPGFATPLFDDAYQRSNNCQDIANSVFGPNMRASSLITNKFSQLTVPFLPADFTGGQLTKTLTDVLYNCIISNSGADQPIMQFLANYIAPGQGQAPMTMWVPNILYEDGNPAVFLIGGYSEFVLASNSGNGVQWSPGNLQAFLKLLLAGAHFVAISAAEDFANQGSPNYNGRALYTAFQNSGLSQREDFANSHYCNPSLYNNTGYYYLNITEQWAPPNCGLVLALLFGSTVNNSRSPAPGTFNTFMQLEGWPASGTGGGRHKADYEAYKKTLWNTSTYGACPYSEKRATTVFLAPPAWIPKIYQTTLMMPYVGAYANGFYPNGVPQSWLDTSVARVPPHAPVLPVQYYM